MSIAYAQVKDVYGNTLAELGAKNGDIFAIEADLMKASGTAPFKKAFPDRHLNVGIAEQNLVGIAAGLAAMGRIPYACTMANFMAKRACDQVAMSGAYNNFNVKLVGCYAGLTQEKNGGTHISFIDLGIMRSLPNMKVIAPADCQEFAQAVKAMSADEGPTYLRMPKLLPESIFDSGHAFAIGKGYVVGDGSDVTLIATGLMTSIAIEALEALKKEGIRARALHLPTIKPVDRDLIVRCAQETGALLTAEDHSVLSGLGSLVAEIVTEECPVPVCRLGLNDQFGLTAGLDFQLRHFGLTVENIVKNAKELVRKK
ncbi:MAG: transketolase family protein [bacterium]|nr:transketolase family protein [bacterium]